MNETSNSINPIVQEARQEAIRNRYVGKRVLFIGVDLHKDSLTTVGVDTEGNIVFCTSLATKCRNQIIAFFMAQKTHWDHVLVAVESVGFYQWFWDLVQPLVQEIHLANASQVRAAAGKRAKTDKNDAETLARLLRDERLPTAFVPDPELRDLRAFFRHRMRLARRLSSAKNSIRMEMGKLGLAGPKVISTDSLHKWMTGQRNKLTAPALFALKDLAAHVRLLEEQLLDREDELRRLVEASPRFRAPVARAMTAPGIGFITAVALYVETGGLTRFAEEKEICCYVGLTPRVFQSAETIRHGRISKAGPPVLRKCLIQAAWTAVRECEDIRRIYETARRKSGKKRAIVKVARKILVWAWSMEKHQTAFDMAKIGPKKAA